MAWEKSCTRGEEMRSIEHTVLSGDWAYVRRDPRQPPGADKPGLLSLRAPSLLELRVGATPTGVVALGFLRSYDERMGELEVSCARGCACNRTILQGWHSRRSSVLAFGILATTASDDCVLRLEHRARMAARGRGGGAFGVAKHIPTSAGVLRGVGSSMSIAASAGSGGGTHGGTSSKFKLAAVIVPPFAVDPADRDVVSAKGLLS